MSTPTALYRLFGDDDVLLYIGITDDLGRRWREHQKAQAWWPQVRHRTAEWHGSREEAEAAEVITIGVEHPRYNVRHNRHPRPGQRGHWNRSGPVLVSPLSLSEGELSSLPGTIDLVEAAALIGMSRKKAYVAARQGTFPSRALPLGPRYRVPTLELLDTPGLVFDGYQLQALLPGVRTRPIRAMPDAWAAVAAMIPRAKQDAA